MEKCSMHLVFFYLFLAPKYILKLDDGKNEQNKTEADGG